MSPMRKTLLLSVLLLVLTLMVKAQPVTITPPSANIQPGQSVTLTASGAMYYQWSPATGLSTTDGPVTVASPMVTTTYICSGYAPGDESVVNGDFEQGNFGFTSAYEYSSNLWAEGTYYVDSDASLHHDNFHGLAHGGTGNFMIINGATVPGTNVWTEQIAVNPHTYYAFSTWVCTIGGSAHQVANLQFSINGEQVGDVFYAPAFQNTWDRFYELWYSGDATSATITILNQNTGGDGNDFGLDDISFCELVLVGAPECTVSVGSMSVSASADDVELCAGESTTLHAFPVNGSGNYTYSWTPSNTLNNPSVQHPIATPAVGTTTYTCHVVDVDWNNTQDVGVSLTVFPPNDTIVDPRSICESQTLFWHGHEYDQYAPIGYFDTVDNHGCLKVYKLELAVGEYQTPSDWNPNQYVCVPHGEDPHYHWAIANKDYERNAIDSVVIPDPEGGCDFKYYLNLKFHQEFYSEVWADTCDEYFWPISGENYDTTQQVTKTFKHSFGDVECDSTYVLNLNITYSPSPEKIICTTPSAVVFGMPGAEADTVAVVTNTEFFSFQYSFYVVEPNRECIWNSCKWSINKPSWSLGDTLTGLSPDGTYYSKCTVYVAERDDDYVVLTATIYNGCNSEERNIYLKPSFFDIEEQYNSQPDFTIVPNPNDGQMTLIFNRFEGKVNVKVYDVTGNMIDSFETCNDLESKALEYELNARKGIYFFVANGREGSVAKKVVIR